MPIFIIIIIIFTMANLGLPGTSSFVGEFLLWFLLLKLTQHLVSLLLHL